MIDTIQLAKLLPEGPSADEEAPYLVLADWLQTQGDPWGELIVLQQRLAIAKDKAKPELEATIETVLAEHGTALVGEAIAHAGSRFDWHLGFIRGATIAFDPSQPLLPILADFVARPIASQLRTLTLSPVIEDMQTVNDWDDSDVNTVAPFEDLASIAKLVPERVKVLGLGQSPPAAAAAYVRMPSFTAITEAFPHLTHLELTGSVTNEPGALQLPVLKELVVRASEIDSATLDAITGSELPKLERLTVTFGGNAYCVLDDIIGEDDDTFSASELDMLDVQSISGAAAGAGLESFLAALPHRLRHLGLQSLVFDDTMIGVIAAWPGLAKLASLDLSGGTLSAFEALVRAKKAFSHLTTLDLSRNLLEAPALKKLRTALPNAKLDDQREKPLMQEPSPELFIRYVATME